MLSRVRLSVTLWATRLLCPWDSPGKSTGVGCHALLQGILPAQGLNSHLFKSPALADRFFTTNTTREAPINGINALLKGGFWSFASHEETGTNHTLHLEEGFHHTLSLPPSSSWISR